MAIGKIWQSTGTSERHARAVSISFAFMTYDNIAFVRDGVEANEAHRIVIDAPVQGSVRGQVGLLVDREQGSARICEDSQQEWQERRLTMWND